MASIEQLMQQEQTKEPVSEPIITRYYDPEAIKNENRKKEQLSAQIKRSDLYFFEYVLTPLAKLYGSEAGTERSKVEAEGAAIRSSLQSLRFENENFIIKAASPYENQVLKKYSNLLKESGIDKIEFFA